MARKYNVAIRRADSALALTLQLSWVALNTSPRLSVPICELGTTEPSLLVAVRIESNGISNAL